MENTTSAPSPAPAPGTARLRPGCVAVGVDGSEHGEAALHWAADQARLEHRQLAVVHAADTATAFAAAWIDAVGVDHAALAHEVEVAANALVERAARQVRTTHPDLDVVPLVRLSDPRQALLDAAQHASLVVVGSRGRGPVRSLLLGSVSSSVARHATCPVVVVRPGPRHGDAEAVERHRSGVVVGLDLSAPAEPVLQFAFQQASLRREPLTVLHCHGDELALALGVHGIGPTDELDEVRRHVAEALAGTAEKWPDVEVRESLPEDLPEHALVTATRTAQLLVIGWHRSHSSTALLPGALAAAVVERAHGPVAVVHS